MSDGPGFKRLQEAPGAEQLRQDTVAVQAKARKEAKKRIEAAAKGKKAKPAAKKATTARITDDLIIKVLAGATNPFKPKSEANKRAQYVLNADGRSVEAAKRGRDGCFVKALVDRKLIRLVRP